MNILSYFWNTSIWVIFVIIYHFGEKVKLILSGSMVRALSQWRSIMAMGAQRKAIMG
jgi:hypothetical protein